MTVKEGLGEADCGIMCQFRQEGLAQAWERGSIPITMEKARRKALKFNTFTEDLHTCTAPCRAAQKL